MSRDSDALGLLVLPGGEDPTEQGTPAGRDWAIPAAAVAEVVRAEDLTPPAPGGPEWLLGTRDWRGIRLPAVLLTADPEGRSRKGQGRWAAGYLAVCRGLTGDPSLPFFAIGSPGLPRLKSVTLERLTEDTDQGEREFSLAPMSLEGRPLALVDLERIERALLALPNGN